MANKTYQGRIVQKHDTSANWAKATNFIPLKGEIIIYDDLNKIKIGDGTTKVNDLKFSSCLPDGGTAGDALIKGTDSGEWETPIEATLISLPTGILKSDGKTISAAIAGVDYAAVTSTQTYNVTEDTVATFALPSDTTDTSAISVYYNGILLEEGENYTITDNTITLKDWSATKGDYITIKITDGASTINITGQIYSVGETAPSNTNLFWIDTTSGLKYYDGSAWVKVPFIQ